MMLRQVLLVQSNKDKHILNITDFMFLPPLLEYHNERWTWRDLAIAIKNDCKKVLIKQVISVRNTADWPLSRISVCLFCK